MCIEHFPTAFATISHNDFKFIHLLAIVDTDITTVIMVVINIVIYINIHIYSSIYLFIHLFIYSFIHLFIYLFIYLLIYSFIYLFIHLFINLFIYLFIYSFIYSTIDLFCGNFCIVSLPLFCFPFRKKPGSFDKNDFELLAPVLDGFSLMTYDYSSQGRWVIVSAVHSFIRLEAVLSFLTKSAPRVLLFCSYHFWRHVWYVAEQTLGNIG